MNWSGCRSCLAQELLLLDSEQKTEEAKQEKSKALGCPFPDVSPPENLYRSKPPARPIPPNRLRPRPLSPIQHSVTLTWTASTSTVARYNVYRGPHSGGPYTRILHPQSRMYGSVALPAEADEILLGILALATSPVYVTDLKTGDRPAARRKYALL